MNPPRLIGQYTTPLCKKGDHINDEIDGLVEVGGFTDAPIPWPRKKKTGKPSLIVTPELVNAIKTESETAISHWWGVSKTKVWQWRKQFGVGRVTEGTRNILRENTGVPPDAAKRGREKAKSAESIEKMRAAKKGKPVSDTTKAALLEACKRPKPKGFGVNANAKMLANKTPKKGSFFSTQEINILKKFYASHGVEYCATRLNRDKLAITQKACKLKIEANFVIRWTNSEDRYLVNNYNRYSAKQIAKKLNRSPTAVRQRASKLGASSTEPTNAQLNRKWTEEEKMFLKDNYSSDTLDFCAEKLNRSSLSIYSMANKLKLKKPRRKRTTNKRE